MALGPGKYDREAEKLRRRLKCNGLVLVVIEGTRGSGAAVQIREDYADVVPEWLERLAAELRRDIATKKGG